MCPPFPVPAVIEIPNGPGIPPRPTFLGYRIQLSQTTWIEEEHGRLDILVNNAGIARGGPPSQTDLDAMREVYQTNVFGVIIVTNAMLPLLRRAPAARIVNVSSTSPLWTRMAPVASSAVTCGPPTPPTTPTAPSPGD